MTGQVRESAQIEAIDEILREAAGMIHPIQSPMRAAQEEEFEQL